MLFFCKFMNIFKVYEHFLKIRQHYWNQRKNLTFTNGFWFFFHSEHFKKSWTSYDLLKFFKWKKDSWIFFEVAVEQAWKKVRGREEQGAELGERELHEPAHVSVITKIPCFQHGIWSTKGHHARTAQGSCTHYNSLEGALLAR